MGSVIESRRGFLAGMLLLAAAPAIVRASSLMPVKATLVDVPRALGISVPNGWTVRITGFNELGHRVTEVLPYRPGEMIFGATKLRRIVNWSIQTPLLYPDAKALGIAPSDA